MPVSSRKRIHGSSSGIAAVYLCCCRRPPSCMVCVFHPTALQRFLSPVSCWFCSKRRHLVARFGLQYHGRQQASLRHLEENAHPKWTSSNKMVSAVVVCLFEVAPKAATRWADNAPAAAACFVARRNLFDSYLRSNFGYGQIDFTSPILLPYPHARRFYDTLGAVGSRRVCCKLDRLLKRQLDVDVLVSRFVSVARPNFSACSNNR